MPYPERGGGGKQAPLMGMGREGGKGLQYEADGSMGFLRPSKKYIPSRLTTPSFLYMLGRTFYDDVTICPTPRLFPHKEFSSFENPVMQFDKYKKPSLLFKPIWEFYTVCEIRNSKK